MPSPLVEQAVIDAWDYGNAILKFISPNDTGKTGAHQCGYYLPKHSWRMFTDNPPRKGKNAEQMVEILWQGNLTTRSCIKWYGVGTRSEYRLTRFGRDFPFLTEDNVGDLLVLIRTGESSFKAFVFDLSDDVEDIQASLGVEVTGTLGIFTGIKKVEETEDDCINRHFRAFVKKLRDFPDTSSFSNTTLKAMLDCIPQFCSFSTDKRLMALIENEYSLFRMAERFLCQNEICRQYRSVEDFLSTASRIMNRRKSRAGRSLENHVGYILKDIKIPFQARADVDGRPDILIPGKEAYLNKNWPVDKLFAVGVKTTCKDRWRQVLNEARRIRRKHILTIQHGISAKQLEEMRDSGVSLVVPKSLHALYPAVSGMQILSLNGFVAVVQRSLAIGS